MKTKGKNTFLIVVISLLAAAIIFGAGLGIGFVGQRFLNRDASESVSGPYQCPPCPEVSTGQTATESESDESATQEVTPLSEISTSEATQCEPCTYINPAENTDEAYQDLFAPFWETWDIIHEQYVDQPVNDETLMQGAIEGMLGSLGDPHTSYMIPMNLSKPTNPLKENTRALALGWIPPATLLKSSAR